MFQHRCFPRLVVYSLTDKKLLIICSGNEDDYIIVSLVRSEKIGFMKEMRRVNVMLTRCKIGMVICTSRSFIASQASQSLIGKLAMTLGEETWVPSRKVLHNGWS